MYCHNGSGNHGCEAIIRSTVKIARNVGEWKFYLISRSPSEDSEYGIDELAVLVPEYSEITRKNVEFFRAYFEQRLRKNPKRMDALSCRESFRVPKGNTISLSIGGDNYCYRGYQLYAGYHQISRAEGHRTVLWGCSVEPEFLEQEDLVADLRTFDRILVRESISYEAMRAKGLTNLALYPDPAFALKPCPAPDVLPQENTVGINLSPMALQYGLKNNDIIGNYLELIRFILLETDMKIALIPHVVWKDNDDRAVLQKLKEYFSGESRVVSVEDMDCTKLKAYISKLRFFVGARTHATIAAYSAGVPVLAVGYSVKSRGIARDLFGTEEHYVVPVDQMSDTGQLKAAFCWIIDHEMQIRKRLKEVIPGYVESAYAAGGELLDLI